MRRILTLAFFLCLAAATAFGQNRLDGKWETERPANSPTSYGQRNQSVQLELSIQGTKASGSLSMGGLGGSFYIFKNGKVTDGKIQFQADDLATGATWTVEAVNDDTVMLFRGDLPIVGNSVLDLINALAAQPRTVLPSATPISAQRGSASIRGTVQDKSKANIPGVKVTALNTDTGAEFATDTN